MFNPFVAAARKLSLLRRTEDLQTRILPLEDIHRATVFLDNIDADADPARRELEMFFKNYDVSLRFVCPHKYELNWFGRIKKRCRPEGGEKGGARDDLFLSLAGPDNFAARYEAKYSTARFKVGIYPMEDHVFDLVIICGEREDILSRQTVYIPAIKEMLTKIK